MTLCGPQNVKFDVIVFVRADQIAWHNDLGRFIGNPEFIFIILLSHFRRATF